MPNTLTPAMDTADIIKKAADDLFWCTRERYFADGNMVLRGGNELVSLYSRPTAEDAVRIAAGLNATLDPIRKRRVVDILAKLRSAIDALEAEDF